MACLAAELFQIHWNLKTAVLSEKELQRGREGGREGWKCILYNKREGTKYRNTERDKETVAKGHFIHLNMSGRHICFVCISGQCRQKHGVSWIHALHKVYLCHICIPWPLKTLDCTRVVPLCGLFCFALRLSISHLVWSSQYLIPKQYLWLHSARVQERVIYAHESWKSLVISCLIHKGKDFFHPLPQITTGVWIYDRSVTIVCWSWSIW